MGGIVWLGDSDALAVLVVRRTGTALLAAAPNSVQGSRLDVRVAPPATGVASGPATSSKHVDHGPSGPANPRRSVQADGFINAERSRRLPLRYTWRAG